jgi:hypothetical protein
MSVSVFNGQITVLRIIQNHHVGKVNMELQLDATKTVLLILEINKTVFVASSWSSIFSLPTLMMHGQTQIKTIVDRM